MKLLFLSSNENECRHAGEVVHQSYNKYELKCSGLDMNVLNHLQSNDFDLVILSDILLEENNQNLLEKIRKTTRAKNTPFHVVYRESSPVKFDICNKLEVDCIYKMPMENQQFLINLKSAVNYSKKLKQLFAETGEVARDNQLAGEIYRSLFKHSTEAVFLYDFTGTLLDANDNALKILGITRKDIHNVNIVDLVEDEELKKYFFYYPGIIENSSEYKLKRKDGVPVYLEIKGTEIFKNQKPYGILAIASDISEKKEKEEIIKQKNIELNFYKLALDGFKDYKVAVIDRYNFFKMANKWYLELYNLDEENIKYKKIYDLYSTEEYENKIKPYLNQAFAGEIVNFKEWFYFPGYGSRNMDVFYYPLKDNNDTTQWIGIIFRDITEQHMMHEKLEYLSFHDSMTGVYNRASFEEELNQEHVKYTHPVSIIIADVDGLKLVNDTIGHDAGDRLLINAASVIKSSFRKNDIIARIGGDEFGVLLPNTGSNDAEKAVRRIKKNIEDYNRNQLEFPLSISIGFSSSSSADFDIKEVFKEADNSMYSEKLHHSSSAKSAIVYTLKKALEERDFITEGHGERMEELAVELAEKIGLTGRTLSNLRLLAKFHDIGKVGIPDRILFKTSPLTREEFEIMKSHCEIGHRIAQSAPDLFPIADLILKHHEWWNGEGYPLGIKGEEIPLESRIIAIVDAFDAMTNHRPYRSAFSREKALEELVKCSGTQFDPHLVNEFVKIINSYS